VLIVYSLPFASSRARGATRKSRHHGVSEEAAQFPSDRRGAAAGAAAGVARERSADVAAGASTGVAVPSGGGKIERLCRYGSSR
jgi:hypothetical protein